MRIILLISFLAFSLSESNGQVIVDNQFTIHPFVSEISPANIRKFVSGPIKLEKKTMRNPNSAGLDTLLTFKSTGCEFTFLKTAHKTFFYAAIITRQCVKFSKGIHVGISKSNFIKIFGNQKELIGLNPIVITDVEESWKDSFHFKNEKLVKIVLSGSVD